MPAREILQEYLVSLGATVNTPSVAKFNDALRLMEQHVESMTSGLATGFVRAGGIAVGALTTLAGATVGLMDNVAQSDLQMQILARRMFMTTDATRKMKMATDALGVSFGDILFGPPELRERYSKLVADETRMFETLGMADFEKQMRQVRDVRFEFTRLENEVKIFSMSLVKDLGKALFGDENAILNKLRAFNEWFIQSMPELSSKVATYLVPILRETWSILKDIGEIGRVVGSSLMQFVGILYNDKKLKDGALSIENIGAAIKHVADTVKDFTQGVRDLADFIDRHEYLKNMLGGAIAGGAATTAMGMGPLPGMAGGAITGLVITEAQRGSAKGFGSLISEYSALHGLDPAMVQALIGRESSFNPLAINAQSGASGLMQLMPETAARYGLRGEGLFDPEANISAGTKYLEDLSKRYGGDWNRMLKDYGGFKSADPSGYINDITREAERLRQGTDYKPMSYSPGSGSSTVNVGGVTVNVTHPAATAHEIAAAVSQTIEERLGRRTVNNMLQLGGVMA